MTGLVRKAILLSAVGIMIAGAAMAGVPNAGNSSKPSAINTTGYTNPPDPAGQVLYVIRDLNNIAVANAEVVLDFTACTDVRLSQNIAGANVVTTCGSHRVTGNTDGLGVLAVRVVAGGNGNSAPRASHDCVLVTVNSVPFPNINAATFDRDGTNGVGAGDLSLVISDFVNNPSAGRSDFDNSGSVGAGDLSILNGIFVAGASALSGAPYCP
jgi:hypothetical protein